MIQRIEIRAKNKPDYKIAGQIEDWHLVSNSTTLLWISPDIQYYVSTYVTWRQVKP